MGGCGCEESPAGCMQLKILRLFFCVCVCARFCCSSCLGWPASSSACPGRSRQLGSAPLFLQGCKAAQLLTDREMRGGDAGWGHKQGEAEEEKAERESPALEYTATTRRHRERERHRETGWLFLGGSTGSLRRCGYELKRDTGRGRDRVPISRNLTVKVEN